MAVATNAESTRSPNSHAARPAPDRVSPCSMARQLASLVQRTLAEVDPEIARAIDAEAGRQNRGLELIASENFASVAVMQAAGSVMTNKYAEGYPGRRYYGGCEFVDVAESLA